MVCLYAFTIWLLVVFLCALIASFLWVVIVDLSVHPFPSCSFITVAGVIKLMYFGGLNQCDKIIESRKFQSSVVYSLWCSFQNYGLL